MDGGKCPVGVDTAMEAEQLAVQRQTQLGCSIVARYCCPGREPVVHLICHKKYVHLDARVPKGWATEEHQNNQQVDQAAKSEVAQVDLDWQHKGELFIAQRARDTSGHQGRDATYRWAHDRGVDLTMDTIAQVIHEWETRCNQASQAVKASLIDYLTLPQTRQGKRYVLTMLEATTGWLETYPMPHATSWITILGLEKQVLCVDASARRLGVHKKLGEDTAGTADPN
ncbi:hypothetical protein QYF61_014057 [Mycteria americana]|uniref:Uncharacterized protein n=1 Tax=Mycteria americana TaxID=33587 RepID=A0AAN7NFP5_MYCAM|nr:hypothetical protein QYF61_014057 [Mycteria americana]